MAVSVIANPLTNLFNYCIKTAIYPKALRSAKVNAIFKSGNKKMLANYKTYFITITFSRIFEIFSSIK